MEIYDIHTHQISIKNSEDPCYSTILSVSPLEFDSTKYSHIHYFSCGIHPWYCKESFNYTSYLKEIATDDKILAIGEAGLDKLKGPSLEFQISMFKEHISLSENLKKPLIIHCVKMWDELIDIKKTIKPSQPWIIHGYRGNVELTKQLIDEEFLFSIGNNLNTSSLPLIPMDFIFCETDNSGVNIIDIYTQLSKALNIDINELALIISKNVRRIFPTIEVPRSYIFEKSEED